LIFNCGVCGTQFATDEWKMEEVNNGFMGFMTMASNVQEKPTFRCPVCKNKVTGVEKYIAPKLKGSVK
jgi:DNA-directed RNA polymerase subunit RPC12/RpoP